jgi:hypothetical protein
MSCDGEVVGELAWYNDDDLQDVAVTVCLREELVGLDVRYSAMGERIIQLWLSGTEAMRLAETMDAETPDEEAAMTPLTQLHLKNPKAGPEDDILVRARAASVYVCPRSGGNHYEFVLPREKSTDLTRLLRLAAQRASSRSGA